MRQKQTHNFPRLVYFNRLKSRMPSGMKKLRTCSSNCARVDALSMGWQDVLKQRKRPLLGRPPWVSTAAVAVKFD